MGVESMRRNHKKYVNIEIEKWQKYIQNLDDKLEIYESFLKSNRD